LTTSATTPAADLAGARTLLAAYLAPQGFQVALLGGLLLASTALQLANPQIIRQFIDAATSNHASGSALSVTALLFIGVALVQQASVVGAAYVSQVVGGGWWPWSLGRGSAPWRFSPGAS
jgi:ABC-type multidrug transport system fused ATPase/permease subunit